MAEAVLAEWQPARRERLPRAARFRPLPRRQRLAIALGWASNPLEDIDRLCDTVVGLLSWRYHEEVAAWRIQLIDHCLEELSGQLRRASMAEPDVLRRLSAARSEFLAAETLPSRSSRLQDAGERLEDCCMQIWRRAREIDPKSITRIRFRA